MDKKNIGGVLLVVILVGLGFLISSRAPQAPQSGKLSVAASFYPMYFFASQIGGDKAEVFNVTPAGGEPHDYEPTAQDTAKIESANLLVLNGGGLEAWGEKIRANVSSTTIVVTAGENLTNQTVVEDGATITDPHVWLAPPLAEQMVDKIEAGFEKADPANASYYATNASALKSKLASLDAEYRTGLASCSKKDIITSHAAFGYLATAYHLNQVPIAGLSPDAEPSPKQLADIADFAKKNNVKIIFFEDLISPKLSQTIAAEVGAQTMVLSPIEGLTNDDIRAGKSYLTQMEQNLTNLKVALECKP